MHSEIENVVDVANEIYKLYLPDGVWPLEDNFRVKHES